MLEGVRGGVYGAPLEVGRVLGEHCSTWEGCNGAPLVFMKDVS